MKGAIYSRVSTEIQDYGKQTDELKEYAIRNGIEVKYIFEEKVSGFKDDRIEFQKLEKLTKDDVDIILVWELSRLSRRSIFIQQVVKGFADKGICVFTKKEGLYTLNDDGTENRNAMFTIGVISMIAEQEVETMKERTLSSKRRYILKEGRSYTSKAPYGYDYNSKNRQLTINEDEANIVRRMFQLSIDGVSTNRISKILTSEHIRTKKNNCNWSLATIRDLLHNPVYKGQPEYTMKIKGKKVTEIVSAPAIISIETFSLSEEKLSERRSRSKSEMLTQPLLRGLIFCTDCGRRYICGSGRDLYACQVRFDNIRANSIIDCNSAGIKAGNIEPIIWKLVETLFKNDIVANKAQEKTEPYLNQLYKLSEQKARFESQRDKINKDAGRLFDTAILIKDINISVFNSKMEEFKDMSNEANKYQKEVDLITNKENSIKKRIKAIEEIRNITITDESEKYEMLHKVIEAIKIYSIKVNQKVFTVLFTSGLEYNVLYKVNKSKFRIEYAFIDDETATFNKKEKSIINKCPDSLSSLISDFTVTSNNNKVFDEEVFGDYSFSELWDILEQYNKTEILKEWTPNYAKRAANKKSK